MRFERNFLDKGLAKLGDSLANFILSLALSEFTGRPTGERVPNASLAMALELAGMRNLIPPRTDKHGKGDIAEAFLAYAWLRGYVTVNEAVEVVRRSLTDDVLRYGRKKECIGRAFAELYRLLLVRMGTESE
ncbi:MAG: hypothetical protein GXO14_05530 [Thermococci archaeon]|nr:hypothetical protein [Thermococci archaeon]